MDIIDYGRALPLYATSENGSAGGTRRLSAGARSPARSPGKRIDLDRARGRRPGRFLLVLAALISLGASVSPAGAQERWLLSADPTLVIGSADGPISETFHDVRGVVTDAEGRIIVADGGSAQMRVFSPAGSFLRSFGKPGDGPKEFRRLRWIDRCGGEAVVAYDSRRHRITKWDAEGSLLEEFIVEGPVADLPPYRVSCGPAGAFVVIGWPRMDAVARNRGPYRPNVPIGIADERGVQERFLGRFPGEERIRTGPNDRPDPFGKSTVARMGRAGRVYVGTADSFAIEMISPDGGTHVFGTGGPTAPLSRRDRERWVDAYVSGAPPDQRPILKRRLLESGWLPTTAPAYAGFQMDRLGFLWVEPHMIGGSGPGDVAEWSVFDADGRFAATVRIPVGFRPTEIASDYVLGISTDAMGIQRVHRYTLTR